ncbi:MAG TPA: formate dehydrogenase accessory sulfurtransferase FdhD [Burkholderiaceae bacterium]|nr:formate dehydrogenase accessory sulfurtransferase FdhD [Burkholderiaceae bacterium]
MAPVSERAPLWSSDDLARSSTRDLRLAKATTVLTQAKDALTREIEILDQHGQRRRIAIPVERPLTVFVDKRELVTLMTLGEAPELLVLGYLINQRLIASADEVESITVDWDVEAAAVRTRSSGR